MHSLFSSRSHSRPGALLGLLAAVGLVLAAAAQSGVRSPAGVSGKAADPTIALVLDDLTNPVELPLRRGAEDAAKKYGFTLKVVGPSPATAQNQISLMQDLQAQKVDGIVILPIDSTALVPAINSAVGAGVAVATTEIDAPDSNRAFYYFGGSPPLLQGKMQADRVAAYFKSKKAKGTINFMVTSCLPTVTGQQDRRSGFEKEVAQLNKRNKFKLKEIAAAFAETK